MKIEAVELRRVRMPLVTPWRTTYGVEHERDVLLVRVGADGVDGYGECGALSTPGYSPEWVDGAHAVLRRFLAPQAVGRALDVDALDGAFATVVGHPMAKAALEMAVLDAQLQVERRSLANWLGATRDHVPAGVALGITERLEDLLRAVESFVADGYQRVKLKIEPGRDIEVVKAVRSRLPELPLQVDANGAYTVDDIDHLVALDDFGLLLVEQPFAPDDLPTHAALARRARTPVCLDESITSAASARLALDVHACSVVNVKAPRVGGIREARRIHDLCVAEGVPMWCGGMLETGLGRAVNCALAALPGFALTGDLSASARYYAQDLTEPFVLEGGTLRVPTAPGIGVRPLPDVLATVTTTVETITG